jgi:hypothetical protein
VLEREVSDLPLQQFQHVLLAPLEAMDRGVHLQYRQCVVASPHSLHADEVLLRGSPVEVDQLVCLKRFSDVGFWPRVLDESEEEISTFLVMI